MFQRGIQWGINRARTLFSKVIYSFFNRYSRIFLVGNRLCLDEVARPVLARPTITQTSRNSRTQAIIDKLVIAADLVNNMVWSIQALVPTKAVAIHLYGKFSSQFMGKAGREKSIFSAFLSFSFGPNIDFSLSALPINPPKIIFFTFYTLLIFISGLPGVGKTTLANALAGSFAPKPHTIEINAMEFATLESGQRKLNDWLKIQTNGLKAIIINELEKGLFRYL